MEAPKPSDYRSELLATGSRLRIDAATAEVMRAFELAGVKALLLKGPSIAHWLYRQGEPRTYLDCDLLIAPSDVDAAEEVLRSLRYKQQFDDRQMPSWWREHAGEWVREVDGLTVDLHRTLPGVRVDVEVAWRLLSAELEMVMVAGHPVPALPLPARALHIALHAAQHGVRSPGPLADLERALTTQDKQMWILAAALAAQLDATDAFSTGLRLAPAGSELADRLGLPRVGSVDAQLRATTPPPGALGFEQLARTEGLRARVDIVRRKLVPPAGFLVHWDPRAGKSRGGLLLAYFRRPVWILRHAPGAIRAWRRARRSVRRGRRANGL